MHAGTSPRGGVSAGRGVHRDLIVEIPSRPCTTISVLPVVNQLEAIQKISAAPLVDCPT